VCEDNYLNTNREPPCYENGICGLTHEERFYLHPNNRFAWDVYCQITALSAPDSLGLPTIDKIDFFWNTVELELTKQEHEELFEKIQFINVYRRNILSQRLKNK